MALTKLFGEVEFHRRLVRFGFVTVRNAEEMMESDPEDG